jgi:hypothetical protein
VANPNRESLLLLEKADPEGLGKKKLQNLDSINQDSTKSNYSQAELYPGIMYRLLIDPRKLEVIAHLKSYSNFDWISLLLPTVIGTEGS